MLRYLLTAFFIFLFFNSPAIYAKTVFSDIVNDYEIEIRYSIDSTFFPQSWLEEPISAKATPIDQKELLRIAKIIKTALSKYSLDFIKKNLKGIYLTKEIYFYGQPYGATSSTDVIYLNDKGVNAGYTDEFLEGSIHHEFAHILQRNYSFQKDLWKKCNPKNFKYKSGGVNAIKNNEASLEGSDKFYKMGFLSEYSMSALDEDICVFSERILTRRDEIKQIIEQYQNIKKKYQIWLQFYQSINSGIQMEQIEKEDNQENNTEIKEDNTEKPIEESSESGRGKLKK